MDDPVLLDLPDPYVPDWNSLEAAKSEDPFMFTGVELLKEAATLSSMVAGMMNGTPFKRNEAILLGLLIRMNRLTRLILKDTCDDRGDATSAGTHAH